jgi:hypothetical protein
LTKAAKAKIGEAVREWNSKLENQERKSRGMKTAHADGKFTTMYEKVRLRWADPEMRQAQSDRLRIYEPRELLTKEQRAEIYRDNGARYSAHLRSGMYDVDCPNGCGKRCAPGPMAIHVRGGRCPLKAK